MYWFPTLWYGQKHNAIGPVISVGRGSSLSFDFRYCKIATRTAMAAKLVSMSSTTSVASSHVGIIMLDLMRISFAPVSHIHNLSSIFHILVRLKIIQAERKLQCRVSRCLE